MQKFEIPFNRPEPVGREYEYMRQSLENGVISGAGPFSEKCEAFLKHMLGAELVLLTGSCTASLEMSALLLDLRPGDEVIMPSYTFVSAANAVCLRGAVPKFVEIRPDTLNMDENSWQYCISDRTKAVMPMHYGGVACEMGPIMKLAQQHGLYVVEDAAQCLNAKYNGSHLGTFGDVGAFSFHETKNIICGEGGAIAINNKDLVERAQVIRDNGTNRNAFLFNKVDKYTWVDLGSSFAISDILAAFLFAQLQNLEKITDHRHKIWNVYGSELLPLSERGLLALPTVPPHCETNCHIFYILVDDESTRRRLIEHLRNAGIQSVFHYVPLHLSQVGERLGYRAGMLPVTEELAARLLRLPMFYGLGEKEARRVVTEVFKFYGVAQKKN